MSCRDAYPNPASAIHNLAQYLADTVIPTRPQGFTFNPRNKLCLPLGRHTNPDIYVASIAGHELRLPRIPTVQEVIGWLLHRLALLRRQGIYLGFWTYDAEFYLDLSVLIRGKAAALAFARANFQHSIYHPATDRSLPVDYTVSAAPDLVELFNDTQRDKLVEVAFA